MATTDNFNRTDAADLGANWTPISGLDPFQIVSNAVVATDNFTDAGEVYVSGSFSADQYSQVVVSNLNSGTPAEAGIGVIVRGTTAAQTFYWLVVNNNPSNPWTLAKKVAGSYTLLNGGLDTIADGDTVRLEAEGTTIRVKINGTEVYSTTDSSVASGRPGIAYSSASSDEIIDNWEGGDLSAGTDATVTATQATATAAVTAPPRPRPAWPFAEATIRM